MSGRVGDAFIRSDTLILPEEGRVLPAEVLAHPFNRWFGGQKPDYSKEFHETVTGYHHTGAYPSSYLWDILYCTQPFDKSTGFDTYAAFEPAMARKIIEFMIAEFKPLLERPVGSVCVKHLLTEGKRVEGGVVPVTRYVLLEREERVVKYLVVVEEHDQRGERCVTQHLLFIPGQYLNYLFGYYWPKDALISAAVGSHERLVAMLEVPAS
jgi:hypothetical protein